jgi:FlaA1/EpsC-like NDP-sugar epimerase
MLMIVASFFLAYLIRFNLTINFDMSKLALQIPVVVLIALITFLIARSYQGVFERAFFRDLNTIFIAISLWSVFNFSLVVINAKWGIYPDFSIPLSIIILSALLSFVALTASHYVLRSVNNALVKKNLG